MYQQFFNFKERPFHLTPNPAFLYLSRSHEEALAHLNYAFAQGDGFVEITGEVGTGKTTLCRTFIESLGPEPHVAYIFNPKLDSLQLLKAINDEFGIDSTPDNIKDLIDTLNRFLLQSKAANQKVLLLIDEAQNLSPEVLEQLRLLSNLETTTEKLLQIILVGQPELSAMLDSYELRQLAQRITLSCHLTALNAKETAAYIHHRLHIASSNPAAAFSAAAIGHIYRHSRGIPRRINIICDRSLLIAFSRDTRKITAKIVKTAVGELAGRREWHPRRRLLPTVGITCAALALVGLALALFQTDALRHLRAGDQKPPQTPSAAPDRTPPAAADTSHRANPPPAAALPSARPAAPDQLIARLAAVNSDTSRFDAVTAILERWQLTPPESHSVYPADDRAFFETVCKDPGLLIQPIRNGNLALIQKLNLPVILRFDLADDSRPRYGSLLYRHSNQLILRIDSTQELVQTTAADLSRVWSGDAFVCWKNYLNLEGVIPTDAPAESIVTLKLLLRNLGFHQIAPGTTYDSQTTAAVKAIQRKHGLEVDGVVGSLTKIVLYNDNSLFNPPQLTGAAGHYP